MAIFAFDQLIRESIEFDKQAHLGAPLHQFPVALRAQVGTRAVLRAPLRHLLASVKRIDALVVDGHLMFGTIPRTVAEVELLVDHAVAMAARIAKEQGMPWPDDDILVFSESASSKAVRSIDDTVLDAVYAIGYRWMEGDGEAGASQSPYVLLGPSQSEDSKATAGNLVAAFGLAKLNAAVRCGDADVDAFAGLVNDAWECCVQARIFQSVVENELFETADRSRRHVELARRRHSENYAMRDETLQYYVQHQSEFSSVESAAAAIAGKIVPVKHRTVVNWISEYRRMQSARKQ
jgi:hypothetical protein